MIYVSVADKTNNCVSFYAYEDASRIVPSIEYSFQLKDNLRNLVLLVRPDDFESDACNWLRYMLLKKFQSWMESYAENADDNERMDSHSLIDNEEYSLMYAQLKEKYGRKIEAIWDEVTDPKKFIYEDIAIAAYLMTLWKKQREDNSSIAKQTFLDFGCGNGLLVYLLTQEGHNGYGIDLRERKIWHRYNPKVDLRESTWTPDENNFGDVDWIIGNHSDELSPWVPVVRMQVY
jgi:tRNASer (uridine44-2'-O)-methyltransferase